MSGAEIQDEKEGRKNRPLITMRDIVVAGIAASFAIVATVMSTFIVAGIKDNTNRNLIKAHVFFMGQNDGPVPRSPLYTSPPSSSALLTRVPLKQLMPPKTLRNSSEFGFGWNEIDYPAWSDMCAATIDNHVPMIPIFLELKELIFKKAINSEDLNSFFLSSPEGQKHLGIQGDLDSYYSALRAIKLDHSLKDLLSIDWDLILENNGPNTLAIRKISYEFIDANFLFKGGGDDIGFAAAKLQSSESVIFDLSELFEDGILYSEEGTANQKIDHIPTDPILLAGNNFARINVRFFKSKPENANYNVLGRFKIDFVGGPSIKSHPFCFTTL